MNQRQPDDWHDVVPGIIVLATLILLAVGVFFLDTLRREFLEGPTVVLLADDIRGLVPGADVWVAGKAAGRVKSISLAGSGSVHPGRIAVSAILRREAVPTLRADATAQIGKSSLLAPVVIKFRPGSPDAPPFIFTDTLTVTPIPDIETFLAFADSGRVAMAALSHDLNRLEVELASGSGTIQQLRRNTELAAELAEVGHRTARLQESWARSGGFGRLTSDSVSRAQIARLSESANTLSELAAARSSSLAPIAQVLEDIRRRIDRLDTDLQAARGSAGRFLYDGELQLQMERNLAQSDTLQLELKADPFRWLRFRLF